MRAIIRLDVPDWQIGTTATVYFPDTMQKKGVCEADEFLSVRPIRIDGKRNHFIKCGNCRSNLLTGNKFCPECGKAVKWE